MPPGPPRIRPADALDAKPVTDVVVGDMVRPGGSRVSPVIVAAITTTEATVQFFLVDQRTQVYMVGDVVEFEPATPDTIAAAEAAVPTVPPVPGAE